MTKKFRPFGKRERGAATLFVTLVMLLIAGLVLLYTNRGAVTEQRLSANEIRAKRAFAAANAGVEAALSFMTTTTINQNSNIVANAAPFGPANSNQLSYYSVRFCGSTSNLNNTCPSAPGTAPTCSVPLTAASDFKDVTVVSCGWSDDSSAVHQVTQRIVGTPSIPGQMPNPLISKGVAGLATGGATIFNFFNDLTVWSGDALTSVSNNSKTMVRDTANSTYAIANPALNTDGDGQPDYRDLDGGTATCGQVAGYTCSTKGGTLGFDAVTGDTQLSSYSDDAFFEKFLGSSPTDYYNDSVSYKLDLNNTLTGENSTAESSLDGLQAQTIWVSGDLTIPANTVLGSRENPVILIVDGNFHLSNNFTVNGVVYVRGNIDGNGSPTIYGAMVTEGNVSINGNPNIVYDPFADSSLLHNGKPTKLPGSWKDW